MKTQAMETETENTPELVAWTGHLTWAAALPTARQNGWTPMDGTAYEISADDAETLADALDEAGDDVAELIDLCRQGALFIQ
jgi:hypothetical protein